MDRWRRRADEVAHGSGESPRPNREPQYAGQERRKRPSADLARKQGDAGGGEAERDDDPQRLGAERRYAVEAVSEGRHCCEGHDLREREPEQDAVLGLEVGRDFVLLRVHENSLR